MNTVTAVVIRLLCNVARTACFFKLFLGLFRTTTSFFELYFVMPCGLFFFLLLLECCAFVQNAWELTDELVGTSEEEDEG